MDFEICNRKYAIALQMLPIAKNKEKLIFFIK
jgi:hypothetical protein